MKKIIILLCTAVCIFGCNESPKKDYILLSGTITDATSKDYRLVKRFSDQDSPLSIKIADAGTFVSDTITLGTGRYVFSDGRNTSELYLEAGGVYQFSAIEKQFRTTAKLTGTNPDASNYLMTKVARIIRLRGDYAEFNTLDEKEFLAKQKELNESYVSYLDSFPNIQKEFADQERKELYYYNLLTLSKYEKAHRRYAKKSDFKVSDKILQQLEGLDFTDEEEYDRRGSYTSLVNDYFSAKVDKLLEQEDMDKYLAKLKVFGTIPNDHIKNALLFGSAGFDITYTNNMDEYYQEFLAVSTSDTHKETITEKYESLKKLAKGNPSPVFTDFVNHAGGTTSLSDLNGKYVYIDVWATWCGPCLREIPALKKVEKQYHGKNVEFVSVSIDVENAHEKWRNMVTDKELGGIQLLADAAWKSDFVQAYQISGIPRFILIDPNGNIEASNAPRPSSPDLINLFNDLKI
ncbi:MAG: TlpA disulfide reductase family protein [Algibacter sp.]|uniref:TlpA family protein disulfide reductase n=1 Tax=Algibacter sp. TaxID=1872428 RepID=UPI0032991F77